MSESATDRSAPEIVLVTHYYPSKGGGVEIVAFELAKRLIATAGVRIAWFASDTTAPPVLAGLESRPIVAGNVVERRLGIPWPIWNPVCAKSLWSAIGAARAVHLHDVLYMGNLIAFCIAKLRRKPIVVTQHVGLVPYRNRIVLALMAAANRIVGARVLVEADCVAFVSRSVLDYFGRFCAWRSPPHFVPNGVETSLFRPPSNAERVRARAAVGIEEGRRVFIFVGRFVEKKGLELLHELARATPEARWLFAGRGPMDPDAWQLANVQVHRGRSGSTLRELLWSADLLVLPSVGEGFPLVVQEAAACGLTSLVSAETASGYPAARDVLLVEALGPGAASRWLARLRAVIAAREPLPTPVSLAEFTARHWTWQPATAFYQRQFAALCGKG